MNLSTKCNCCCKEEVCKFKGEYVLDCNMIKQTIKSSMTEVNIHCKQFQAHKQTERGTERGTENEN